MKSEYKLFTILAVFLYACTAVYAWWTATAGDPMNPPGRVDWVGTMALLLSGMLCLMLGGYFWFVARRIDLRPEDRPDAEIHEGAGEVGFFSPGSYWPFGLALAAAFAAIGTAFMAWWLVAGGLIAVVLAAAGLLFEYYSGTRRAVEH
ncbi:cytochrome c oxidase polypeptide 4 [Pilimelia terevasa]|uniref:Cytochrome c oxidase polypeptide 4 n=1 Tax=Pilimelia terevasa TaxID=53372 RepID=A0A8J3BN74_9ACTN|nr:cytochrome c oxidase subunit 4 [Pilimelia terevasa]GGK26631.1 cytochrome c oxidase polypeptide 4 [Pilimelia terevasa]